MKVEVLHFTPLVIASKAIRKCWNSEDKSDDGGEKDLAVIERVGNKFNHKSTLRHCHITFDCNDISTKTLLALTRYTVGKEISVQSTRYTYEKRMKDEEPFCTFI